MDNLEAATGIVAIITIFGGITVIACVWLWAWASRGRADGDREEAYQRLAEDTAGAQKRAAFELSQIAEDVADIRTRLVEMERMLKEVP
jgi:hypothetical protein